MLRLIVRSFLFIVLLSAGPLAQPVSAEDVSVDASVNTTTVELGSSLRLTVTVNGADAPPIQFPKIDGLEIRYLGPSTKISVINGKMSRSTGVMFTVIPLRTGQFQIPSLTLPLAGKNYSTEPVAITVVDSGSGGAKTAQSGGDGSDTSALQDKIFLVLSTAKKEAYLNEPIPVDIKLFINELAVKNVQYPSLSTDGFRLEPFAEPERGRQVMGGISYQVLDFKTFLYPTRAGELTLGPAKLGANIVIASSPRRSMPGDIDGIFDNNLFDEFMGHFETKTVMLESAGIGIKVLPLPEEGKPASFSGGVGKYNFEMSVSPSDVKVGDPVTVRMRVAGDGNLKAVEMPAFKESQDLKVYDPKVTEQDGEKTLEQVVIPKHDQVKGLPAVEFSYFDTTEGKYFTVSRGPFPLTVTPLAKGEEAKVVGMSSSVVAAATDQPEALGKDIHFIKENIGPVQRRGAVLLRHGGFILTVIIFALLWLVLFANYLFRQRLTTDHRLARRLQAPRQAKAGLAQAAVFLAKNDSRNFCDTLVKTLQEYFGNKFHVPSTTVTVAVIANHMKNPNDKILEDLRQILSDCELVRFASAQITMEKMKAGLQRAQEIIDFFERNVK